MLRQKLKTKNFKGLWKVVEEIHRSNVRRGKESKLLFFKLCAITVSLEQAIFFFWYRAFDYIVSRESMHGVLGERFIDNGGWKIVTAVEAFCL